jgi:hypothetical protein
VGLKFPWRKPQEFESPRAQFFERGIGAVAAHQLCMLRVRISIILFSKVGRGLISPLFGLSKGVDVDIEKWSALLRDVASLLVCFDENNWWMLS